MNKSDNNVMISEELMRDARRLALEKEVSVSDLVNEVLGEFLYMKNAGINYFDIIHSIEKNIIKSGHFTVSANPCDCGVSVKSPLRYVHRPELKYSVRIMQNNKPYIGEMNVVLRSHNINTLKNFSDFLNLWIELETNYPRHKPHGKVGHTTDSGYYGKKIMLPVNMDNTDGQGIGLAIGNYICTFDKLLKYYFYHPCYNRNEMEKIYIGYVKDGKLNV